MNFLTGLCQILAVLSVSAAFAQGTPASIQPNRPCAALISAGAAGSSSASPALVENEVGERLHQVLSSLVDENIDRMEKLAHSANREITYGRLKQKILEDHARITNRLRQIAAGFKPGSIYAVLIEHVLRKMDQTIYYSAKPFDYSRPMAEIINSKDPHDFELRQSLYEEWGLNRSFIAELQSALEVKGLVGTDLTVEQIVPKKARGIFAEKFKQLKKSYLLQLEIDVVARDPLRGGFVWIEVKNPSHRIVDVQDLRVEKIIRKKALLSEFFDIVNADPQLRVYFNSKIKYSVLIRGAGISAQVADLIFRNFGVNTVESLDGINLMMSKSS